jgi:hypothetical protein
MEPDAPPIASSVEGTYSIVVASYNLPADPCICGDWSEMDEYDRMVVTKDGETYTVDFASYPPIYNLTTTASSPEAWVLDLPPTSWPELNHRTSDIRLRFTDRGEVSAEFLLYNDALASQYEKHLVGTRL